MVGWRKNHCDTSEVMKHFNKAFNIKDIVHSIQTSLMTCRFESTTMELNLSLYYMRENK